MKSFIRLCPSAAGILLCGFASALSFAIPTAASEKKAKEDEMEPLVRTPTTVSINRLVVGEIAGELPNQTNFSPSPTAEQVFRARVFSEPFIPVGGTPTEMETAALASAIQLYVGAPGILTPFSDFISRWPESSWVPSVRLNLGLHEFSVGRYTSAIAHFEAAWQRSKSAPRNAGKEVADRALAELLQMHARLGRREVLEKIFAEVAGREFTGTATELVAGARQGLSLMQERPEAAFRCGPAALDRILARAQKSVGFNPVLMAAASTPQGINLTAVWKLAREAGLELQMAKRAPGADIVSPAVVHWKLGHYAAMFAEGSSYRLEDPTFGANTLATAETINEEASGYFLIPAGSLPAGWTAVGEAEGLSVWGKGTTTMNSTKNTTENDKKTSDNKDCDGMAVASAHLMVVSLNLRDSPVGYVPPKGPAVRFTATYNQREASQPTTIDYSNLGSKWVHDWLAFIDETTVPATGPAQLSATLRLPGGGSETHQTLSMAVSPLVYPYSFQPQQASRTVLTKTAAGSFTRLEADGSQMIFGRKTGMAAPFRYFLTQIVDPAGNALAFSYDAQNRLVGVTDALGQVTTLSYELAASPLKITKVTDPFGRFAKFEYDALGRLEKITDVINIVSQFTYQSTGDFISGLTTPYGTSTFAFGEGTVGGRSRWLELTDPAGNKERVEFRDDYAGLPGAGTLPTGLTTTSLYQNFRNTLYWDKKAMSDQPGNVAAAHIFHWLHTSANEVSGSLENEKAALENRVWYNYEGQTNSQFEGTSARRSKVARVLDDGTTQLYQYEYNPLGLVTKAIDPLGRETTYVYAANNLDVLEVRQKTGTTGQYEILGKATYNAQRRPLTSTDAAGQVTTFTYNAAGQPLTVTNAKSEVTAFVYDTNGYLTSIDGPLAGSADSTTFGYDGFGRLRTVTDSEGYSVTTDYDAFDRPTVVTYPDASFEQIVYGKLDGVKSRDRRGRWTETTYNALRQPVVIRDALARLTQLQWCSCGSLYQLIDGLGQSTTWSYDVQGRKTTKRYHDGKGVLYDYETTTSRLKSTVDARNQTSNYQYFNDGSLKQVSYTGAVVATPTVSYTYELYYPRTSTRTDGSGVTAYAFNPVPLTPTLGAGRLASVDGPLANDTLTYSYDELGRVLTRSLNGSANATSVVYDAMGRLASTTNPLGTFSYAYVNATGRLDHTDYPNGQRTNYSYFNNAGDQRLQQIANLRSGGANLSAFGYTYDAAGTIQSWTRQADSAAVQTLTPGYDAVDQLTSATLTSGSTILQSHFYRYDRAGNRTSEQIDNGVTAAGHNSLNQIMALAPSGPIRVAGTLNEPAIVTVNGVPAAVDAANGFSADVPLAPGTQTVAVVATDGSGNAATQNYQVTVAAGTARTLTHDANGNLTNDGAGKTYEWDAADRLVKITQASGVTEFVYNGASQRVQEKLGGTIIKQWIWDGGAQPVEERDAANTVTKRFYAQGEQLGGTAYFYATDHLGSVRELTDATGAVRARYDYDPFGRVTKVAGDLEADFGFTGFYRHQVSGLGLTLYRGYDPILGRWLSRDPIGEQGGVNLYGYAANSPLNYIDPDGRNPAAITIVRWSASEVIAAAMASGLMIDAMRQESLSRQALQELLNRLAERNKCSNVTFELDFSDSAETLKVDMAEHTKNARPSTEEKHQEAEKRRKIDKGGEKGDARRDPKDPPPRGPKPPKPEKPPEYYKGPKIKDRN